MTWLLLRVLWIASTWLMYPNYQWAEPILEAIQQQEQLLQDEADRNFLAEQEQIIIEDYFLFLDRIGKIKYARWCIGEYSPPVWSEEKQKRIKCSDNAYDCAGLIKGYAVAKGILTTREVWHLNSQTIVLLWTQKDVRTAKRWDFTSRQGYGEKAEGTQSTHFAMVSRDYTGGSSLWIYDNVNGPNHNILWERELHISYNARGWFNYVGAYRITVYTNGLVETARARWITVDSRVVAEPEELPMTPYTNDNPLGFSITIEGYDYDSIVNRIASFRYDNQINNDFEDIFGTMYHESGLDPERVNKEGWDSGVCQRNPRRHQSVIDDPNFKDRERQARECQEKRNAIPDKGFYWKAYKYRDNYKSKIIYMNK